MEPGPESLLPPLVAIVAAIVTRRVVLPLAGGVLVGAFLLAPEQSETPWYATLRIFYLTMETSFSEPSHRQVLAFTLLLGAMVGVLERCGGMRDLIERLSKRIRTRRGAQTMIATSGLAIFFDDYANTLLLGGTMRATADRYRLSREKLAYLVDSTAAPVAGLAVVSTWAAIEISYMGEGLKAVGIDSSSAAFDMFVQSIPYRFYPWLALVTVFAVALSGRDFGPMRRAEAEVSRAGASIDRNAVHDAQRAAGGNRWLWSAAVVPVVLCLAVVFGVLVYTGLQAAGGFDARQGGPLRFAGQVLGQGDPYLALIAAGLTGWIVASVMHLVLARCKLPYVTTSSLIGAYQMVPALVILWFAWGLSSMTEADRLDTGGYLASVLSERLDPRLLPTVVFLTAGAMAFSTGTSWGTMGILTPLSVSLALQLDAAGGASGAVALATSGAVLAGAIFGDHCSPISDTTVLSSRASDCDHVAHVRTQMPYALSAAAVSVVVGTIPATLGISPWLSLAVGAVVLVILVRVVGRPVSEADADAAGEDVA